MHQLRLLKKGESVKYKYLCNYHYQIVNLYSDKQPQINKNKIDYQSNGPIPLVWEIEWTDWGGKDKNNGIKKVKRFNYSELNLPISLIKGFWKIISIKEEIGTEWHGHPENDNFTSSQYNIWKYTSRLNNVLWKFQMAAKQISGFITINDLEIKTPLFELSK